MNGNEVGDDLTKLNEDNSEEFIVKYQDRTYDLQNFLKHHPGGKKTLSFFRNRNVDKAMHENPHSKSAFHLIDECLVRNSAENELEKLVDWNSALFWQVGGLADRYWEWVNLPVNRQIRLFQSDFIEKLTITPWYVVPLIWVPIGLYFIFMGHNNIPSNYAGLEMGFYLFTVFSAYGIGILLWSILEYVLHRKLFHFRPPASSKVLISIHFLLHGVHHKAPFDGQRLLFPPVAGLLVAKGLWDLYVSVFPQSMVPFIAAGTTTGYLCYDLMHYYLHHGSPAADTYLYTMKRSHNYHHFSHHNQGFGISSTVWDNVFGTEISLRKLAQPIEW